MEPRTNVLHSYHYYYASGRKLRCVRGCRCTRWQSCSCFRACCVSPPFLYFFFFWVFLIFFSVPLHPLTKLQFCGVPLHESILFCYICVWTIFLWWIAVSDVKVLAVLGPGAWVGFLPLFCCYILFVSLPPQPIKSCRYLRSCCVRPLVFFCIFFWFACYFSLVSCCRTWQQRCSCFRTWKQSCSVSPILFC